MKITYKNPGFEHSVESILLFQTDETTPYWSDALLYFYPKIDKRELSNKTYAYKREYLLNVLSATYRELEPELENKVVLYNTRWEKYSNQIEAAFSDAFGIDTRLIFNDITANITLNPVGPRFLKEHYFDVFYKNSDKGAIGVSIHEMIHFVWFHVWNQTFKDSYDEYDTPHLKWILSEMVVESIMRDKRLSSINPYFPRENGGCVYRYFQDMIIKDEYILDTLEDIYQRNKMVDFMKKSYEYCMENEGAIRSHIKKSEEKF